MSTVVETAATKKAWMQRTCLDLKQQSSKPRILPIWPGATHFVGQVVVIHLSNVKSLRLMGDGAFEGSRRGSLDLESGMVERMLKFVTSDVV